MAGKLRGRLWLIALVLVGCSDDPGATAETPACPVLTDDDGLAAAAKARSRADWLVGMNLSRAYSLGRDTLFSVGRVQTPTLAMVVDRDRAIRAAGRFASGVRDTSSRHDEAIADAFQSR